MNEQPFKVLFTVGEGGITPRKAYAGDAGFDLFSSREVVVPPNSYFDVPTEIRAALPSGFWAQIISRSSTYRKYRLQVVEAVIDNGYRGELFIQVINNGSAPVTVERHSRIAQLILNRIEPIVWVETAELPPSDRGERGFGSSGS